MAKAKIYSQYSIEAARLLGAQIKLGRKQRKWTETELASRASISRATLQKIEKGDMTCAIGSFFEVAILARVPLFEVDKSIMNLQIERINDKIALLPKTIHKSSKAVDDDF
ncbi:MAG: helix-turn-helix transcriptional regulator [Enterobacterales bacterium]|nr:helix-turn-helix transcriptional regulator [Enterobacterales bacterium]